eukprot:jgi/Botrbrau1/1590/Bobra.0185s0011.1
MSCLACLYNDVSQACKWPWIREGFETKQEALESFLKDTNSSPTVISNSLLELPWKLHV